MKSVDIIGEFFGRLKVITEVDSYISSSGKTKKKKYLCECICGNTLEVIGDNLRRGKTNSCGCYRKELKTTHGDSYSLTYKTWSSMVSRCLHKTSSSFENYGGRGIKVCDRWVNSYQKFLEDMGERPSKDYSIERIDVNGDYEPNNCIWLENKYQNRNIRKKSNNSTGVTGVRFSNSGTCFTATWTDIYGKNRSKSFSISKYGYEEAFKLACEARRKAIEELNKLGANYSENHGL